jgi:hypothetical protein
LGQLELVGTVGSFGGREQSSGTSATTSLHQYFRDEPGVIRAPKKRARNGAAGGAGRTYGVIRVPESVALRVVLADGGRVKSAKFKLRGGRVKLNLEVPNPRRVMLLCGLDGRMT